MEIRRISIFGAGTMGHGIAHVAAQAGYDTNLFDIDERFVKRGLDRIAANLQKGIDRGKVTEAERDDTLGRLGGTIEIEVAAQADLLIEAVPEKLELKIDLFGRLNELSPEESIFASNTSSLSVGEIAAGSGRPSRVLGMHFFNPVHIMQLLEIVVHDGTDDDVLAAAQGVGDRMNKNAIIVRDSPGFATSRLGIVLGLEAMRMLEEGVASAADIDTAMELGYRHPMGPLRLTDLVGLDVRLGIAEYLHETLASEAFRPPEILRAMVRDGRLGKKSGRGFYDWTAD